MVFPDKGNGRFPSVRYRRRNNFKSCKQKIGVLFLVTFLIIFFWWQGTTEDDKLSRPINVTHKIDSSVSLRKDGGVRHANDVTNDYRYAKDGNHEDDYDDEESTSEGKDITNEYRYGEPNHEDGYDDEESTSEGKDVTNDYGYGKDGNHEDDYDDEESTSEGKDVTNDYGYGKDGNHEDDYDDEESTSEGKDVTNDYGYGKDTNNNNNDEESMSEDGSVNEKRNTHYWVEDEDEGSSKAKNMDEDEGSSKERNVDDDNQDNSTDDGDYDAEFELFKKYYLVTEDDNVDDMNVEENMNFLDFSLETDEGDIGETDGSADVGADDYIYRNGEILSDNDENNGEGFFLDMDGADDDNGGSSNAGDNGAMW